MACSPGKCRNYYTIFVARCLAVFGLVLIFLCAPPAIQNVSLFHSPRMAYELVGYEIMAIVLLWRYFSSSRFFLTLFWGLVPQGSGTNTPVPKAPTKKWVTRAEIETMPWHFSNYRKSISNGNWGKSLN